MQREIQHHYFKKQTSKGENLGRRALLKEIVFLRSTTPFTNQHLVFFKHAFSTIQHKGTVAGGQMSKWGKNIVNTSCNII